MGADQREEAVSREVAHLKRHVTSAPELLAAAARALVADHRGESSDFRNAVVLVPAVHAVPDFARALSAAAAEPAVLLPRITTLSLWAADVPLDKPVSTHTAREAMLYRVLTERGWLKGADLWSVAEELGLLFDELTRSNVALPEDLGDFTRQLEQAYRAREGAALAFEARLVHELWHASLAPGQALDPEVAYGLRLAKLAGEVSLPLCAIGLEDLTPGEERFLERAAARVEVTRFNVETAGDALAHTLTLAWSAVESPCDLRTRAGALSSAQPQSALTGRVRILGAATAEQEAQTVDLTVREWLLEGRTNIGVVVNDRVTARRARALLERAEVYVADEAGWAFSTTSAATAIGRWLDVAANDAYHRDLLDLLKSPFAFCGEPREKRQDAVWRLDAYARDKSVVSGLRNFIAIAEARGDGEVVGMLTRVERGLETLGRSRRPVTRWVEALVESLTGIGVAQGLAADAAGEQLLELLQRLRLELVDESFGVSFAEWRRWLGRKLETSTFRDRAIESPVVFTHLSAAQVRIFDAVLVLGCDAVHLPGPDPTALFFNQAVRGQLHLPTHTERVTKIERELGRLIACADVTALTWQSRSGTGEPNLMSPQIERLSALHQLAYGATLEDADVAARLSGSQVGKSAEPHTLRATAVPMPSAPAALIPTKISASGYNSMMACPYQFYARHVLGLSQLDDVQEEIEKRDYGQLVHDVLSQFHLRHPRISDLDRAVAVGELETLSEHAFAAIISRNYLERAWLMRWLALIPEYIDWQRSREQEGWAWHASEVSRDVEIVTARGRTFTLRGRLDRVDSNGTGAYAVIDYKTQNPKLLERKLQPHGEDVQLPVYALLWGGPVAAALFLSVERDGVKAVPIKEHLAALTEAARERLSSVYDAMHDGAALPAQGIDGVCEYCEARGLCRRNYWP